MEQRHFFRPQSPSTSTANFDGTDLSKFELLREKYIAKMIFAEQKFNELKIGKFSQARKAQIEKRRDVVRKRICPHFLRLKAALDDEYKEKKRKLNTVHTLRLRAAERCRAAEHNAAQLNLRENETALVRQQCTSEVERKLENLNTETKAVEEILHHEFCRSDLTKTECGGKSQKANVPAGRKLLDKYFVGSELSNSKKNDATKGAVMQWRNVPAMIAQLPSHCINDDLTKAFARKRHAVGEIR